jgi:hypothetical protein
VDSFLSSSWDDIEKWFQGKNTDTTGMTPSMTKTAQSGQQMRNLGLLTSVLGGINTAIGTYYAAKSQQYQERSEASSFAFQSDIAAINASRAELTAESIQESGKSQVANYTIRAGQDKAAATATMAAHGIALGFGSAAEVSASQDIEKDLNVLAINSNATRQAWAARQRGTDYQNESLLDRTSSIERAPIGRLDQPWGERFHEPAELGNPDRRAVGLESVDEEADGLGCAGSAAGGDRLRPQRAVAFPLVFGFRFSHGLPLHVRRRILATADQRPDVVNHISGAAAGALASAGARVRSLEGKNRAVAAYVV